MRLKKFILFYWASIAFARLAQSPSLPMWPPCLKCWTALNIHKKILQALMLLQTAPNHIFNYLKYFIMKKFLYKSLREKILK